MQMKTRLWVATLGAIAASGGCSTLYDLDYSTGNASSAANDPQEAGISNGDAIAALTPANDGGLGACVDTDSATLNAACTNALCIPFDNTMRIQGYVPGSMLPPLPEAGAPSTGAPNDGGTANDAGSDAAARTPAPLPPCSSLPAPVYVIGSTGLAGLAAELAELAAVTPITLVFEAAKSCDGAKAIIQNETAFDVGDTTATYWDVAGTAQTCAIDEASKYADIGLGQLFADACLTLPQGAPGVGDFLGPVTPIDMVVPTGSTQNAISAEALYYTLGLGTGAVAPWTNPNMVFYNPGSGPQYDVSQSISVPVSQWIGTKVATAPQNIAKVGTSSDPEGTLGMMGADLVEAANNSSTLKAIAYQDVGMGCGYYPNLTATSAEKQNIRDGHYQLWGYSHMFAKVNAQDVPLSPNAATLISYFTGTQMTPTGDFLKFVINDRLVPVCAMRVTRSSEMGRVVPFTPSPSCGCYFDSLTKGSSSCQVCVANSDCPAAASHCNFGYCEGS